MTAHEARPYRNRLQQLIARLSGDVARLEAEALRPTGAETADRPADVTTQQDDLPAQQAGEEVALALLGTEGQILKEARDALARIENHTFGRCERCGRAISHSRLDVIPYARHCVGCATEAGRSA